MRKGTSIFLRVRNEAKTLKLALQAASYLGDEIVFVDNCSTDNSFEIAEQFKQENKEKKIINVKFEYDSKLREATLSDLYNYALSYTTGKWIIKWDGDLYLDECSCEKVKNAIKKYDENEKVDGLYLSNRVVYNNFQYVSKQLGSEMAILKWRPGLIYTDNHANKEIQVGEEIYKPLQYFLANDILYNPIVWHLRFKNSEQFMRSRLTLEFYSKKIPISFEEFFKQSLNEKTFDELQHEYLRNSIEEYNEQKHGKIPQILKDFFEIK